LMCVLLIAYHVSFCVDLEILYSTSNEDLSSSAIFYFLN
jgi:hypothetical protein